LGSKQQAKKSSKPQGKKRDTKARDRRSSGKKSASRAEAAVAERSSELAPGGSLPAITDVDLRLRELQLRLAHLQDQFVGVVEALGESTARLQAAVLLIADLPTRDAATDSARELRQRLEQMLVAQQRTNELLDLALGVATSGLPSSMR
jgi:hypothetical protein